MPRGRKAAAVSDDVAPPSPAPKKAPKKARKPTAKKAKGPKKAKPAGKTVYDPSKRTFKIGTVTFKGLSSASEEKLRGGRFKSSDPGSAARKAARRIYKISEKHGIALPAGRIPFTLQETTRGGPKKGHHREYFALREELSTPQTRVINGKTIVHRHVYSAVHTDV